MSPTGKAEAAITRNRDLESTSNVQQHRQNTSHLPIAWETGREFAVAPDGGIMCIMHSLNGTTHLQLGVDFTGTVTSTMRLHSTTSCALVLNSASSDVYDFYSVHFELLRVWLER